MTPIENEAFADGFRLCLLGARRDPASGAADARAVLFDGGRAVRRWTAGTNLREADPAFFDGLNGMLRAVAGPPHVLAIWGGGCPALLVRVATPAILACYRILDLRRSAIALADGLRPSSSTGAILRAYGLPAVDDAASPLSPAHEDLLWAVVAAAGRRGLDWPGLLAAAGAARKPAPFDRYAFDEAALAALPEAPGVYAMRDTEGRLLYVGKSSSLRRRMSEYFRPASAPGPKVRMLRERVRTLECRPVGSELEALLVEEKWIREGGPDVNVQRRVEEGASRYRPGPGPVAVIGPSVRSGCVELFAWAPGDSAFQVRIRVERPSAAALRTLYARVTGRSRRAPRAAGITDWGRTGAEICHRLFSRGPGRLQWLDPSGAPTAEGFAAAVVSAARAVLARDPDPGEFRGLDAAG
ncbi:MAG: nucleotide excision repair endonuclease [Lentisphaerae bacterium]|nr:nucleotide excision repair endonuclease [Lentisphaerota bacterium]